MLAGLDSRNFAAPSRQILAGIAAHAIGAPIARVLTQPGPTTDVDRTVKTIEISRCNSLFPTRSQCYPLEGQAAPYRFRTIKFAS